VGARGSVALGDFSEVPRFASLATHAVWPPRDAPLNAPVRSPLGRDGPNSLTCMASTPGSVGRPLRGFGMGSVGEGGSVGPAKRRSVSSAYSQRTRLSVVLKIRVSMVRFRPWPPLPSFGLVTGFAYHPRTIGNRVDAGPERTPAGRRAGDVPPLSVAGRSSVGWRTFRPARPVTAIAACSKVT